MRILELFAGSRSIGKIAEEMGMEVFSSDIEAFNDIDYVVNLLDFDVTAVPWKPDIIWASPPCTGFSVAAIGHHWGGGKQAYIPKTIIAQTGIKLVKKTLEIINHFQPSFFFIENPRGILRKLDILSAIPRETVTYCQYGDSRMKPTDIWHSSGWKGRPMCKNGDKCHIAAPRGSRTGTQGIKGAYNRSILPPQLCKEILIHCLEPQPQQKD